MPFNIHTDAMIVMTLSVRRSVAIGSLPVLRCSLLLVLLASAVGCSDDLFLPIDRLRLTGTLNGEAVNVPASASLLRSPNAPDSLFIGGELPEAYISLKVEYSGPGTYALTRDNTEIVLLVGGDVRTGQYQGTTPRAGDLVITDDAGPGGVLQARFWFDAEHAANAQRFGPTVAFRDGVMSARLRVFERP